MKLTVLVYDFNPMGHCPGWMYLVASGFRASGADVYVFCRKQDPRVIAWAEKLMAQGCVVGEIPESIKDHAAHSEAIARKERITKVFFPNFDSIIYEMGKYRIHTAFAGMDIGGIWLRPDLHALPISWIDKCRMKLIRTRANKVTRRHARAVANNRRGLQAFLPENGNSVRTRLFFTSSDAMADVADFLGKAAVARICDPWLERTHFDKTYARAALNIPQDRLVLLHAGTSRPEKGLKDVCTALLDLNDVCINRFFLIRAGSVDTQDVPSLKRLEQKKAALVLDYFVSEDELSMCYAAADWVLLPYRHQKESSGLLIHAAANLRPVIASDYGIIGNCVKTYNLGRLFAHCNVEALNRQFRELIDGDEHNNWDPAGMKQFADLNSPAAFQQTLIESWLTDPSRHSGAPR